jgi:hypothetical protein
MPCRPEVDLLTGPENGVHTITGATMPNGQKYEDWLKDRREKGENGGPS